MIFCPQFYRGSEQDPFVSGLARGLPDAHTEYCGSLWEEMESRTEQLAQEAGFQSEQVLMGGGARSGGNLEQALGELPVLFEWNCAHVGTPFMMMRHADFATEEDSLGDPSRALLQFMIAATPNEGLAQEMMANPKAYLEKMSASWETHFVGGHGVITAMVDNVPDTVNAVKAKVSFVQVPKGESTSLELVWKFEVEMQDNWYEAAVSTSTPHRIVSVVDWASDSPMAAPVAPVPKEPVEPKYGVYNVFGWGINDPTVGNRSMEKENFDVLASPVGWHAMPIENDPASGTRGGKVWTANGHRWVNTTTTWGINVFAHENWEGQNDWMVNYRPDAGAEMVFNYTYDPQLTDRTDSLDEAKKYINATVTQLFYSANMVHDLYYR